MTSYPRLAPLPPRSSPRRSSPAAVATSAVAGLASAHRYSTLFLIAAIITVPVLVAGTLGRWRYSAAAIPVSAEPGGIT
jgi:hypothetical protein